MKLGYNCIKLEKYRWGREDSTMNINNYRDLTLRFLIFRADYRFGLRMTLIRTVLR